MSYGFLQRIFSITNTRNKKFKLVTIFNVKFKLKRGKYQLRLYNVFSKKYEKTLNKLKSDKKNRKLRVAFYVNDTKWKYQNLYDLLFKSKDYSPFIIVGKSIKATNHIANNVLADVFESITAAIYLDGGFEETKKFVSKFVLQNVNSVLNTDYKTFLQEKIAGLHNDYKIEYKLMNSLGPSHELTFEMAVCLNGKIMATAKGKNKKEAEQLCAKLFLEQIEKNGLNS